MPCDACNNNNNGESGMANVMQNDAKAGEVGKLRLTRVSVDNKTEWNLEYR